ncbi:family 43 glycosylhydrolase [Sphingomonas sp. SUN039]|uniref:family 43 glycosylhydrolase n=1 Tax=Sphingomonas sp. SUN039 TaxID=2937787 RepID=UPI0021641A89|nr:family 43 glycosylhydrolase [Sphingomonas sp. SUN039]UVO53089.1 family 43 glycosylhydrolase [Sphingomonas sp. SUN039]
MGSSRRDALKMTIGAGAALTVGQADALAATGTAAEARTANCTAPRVIWGRTPEGRRKADLGNGHYRNPVLPGDYPDPTILKDGDDYYLTHSSFDAMPGLLIWHSRDLVNWSPVCAALPKPIGTVFACDLIRHGGRYFIYIPFMKAPWSSGLKSFANIYVIHADNIAGPWSAPVDTGIGGYIDPGHVVDTDGQRYLYLSGIHRVLLTPDGLAPAGPIEKVYDGWRYPDDWVVEGYSLEGPKLLRKGDWFYLISAVGGTGGPPTGHMVIAARSRSAKGPWENCPHNPIVRTWNAAEPWHSRGHATAVEGPGGQWYLVYHGYENGYQTLGRQTLLEPMVWTADGWPRATGGDLSKPLPVEARPSPRPPLLLSDDFSTDAIGTRWTLHINGEPDRSLAQVRENALWLKAQGSGPQNGTVLTQQTGDRAYQAQVTMSLGEGAEGGLLLFFSDRLFLGISHNGERMITYGGGQPGHWREPAPPTRKIHLRVVNDHHIVTYYWSLDGRDWTRHEIRAETSGCHANTMQDLTSLRVALFAAGTGTVRFDRFVYRATDDFATADAGRAPQRRKMETG